MLPFPAGDVASSLRATSDGDGPSRRDLPALRVRPPAEGPPPAVLSHRGIARRCARPVSGIRGGRGATRQRPVWLALVHVAPPLTASDSIRFNRRNRW